MYHAYLITTDLQVKETTSFLYAESLMAGATTETDCKAPKVMETYEQDGNDVKCGEGADVPDMRTYFIASEFPEEGVVMPLVMHLGLLYCL